MTVTRCDMKCAPADVMTVLADGWLLGLWVVGASRIRAVDPSWPAAGSLVHHSVGSWPLLLDDTTSVQEYIPGRSLRLRARAWPAGEAQVLLEVTGTATGCRVTMTEDAVKGPALLVPKPVRSAGLHYRNVEALRRLSYIAESRGGPRIPTK